MAVMTAGRNFQICWLYLQSLSSQSEAKVTKHNQPSFLSRAEFFIWPICVRNHLRFTSVLVFFFFSVPVADLQSDELNITQVF